MLLEINNVSKTYRGGVKANIDISLSVAKGEVFGLLGPNGAGKTTLVNQIIGLAMPSSGSITINGVNVVANPDYARNSCSFQAQVQAPISGLNTLQAIELVGRIRGGRAKDVRRRAMELIEKLEISEWKQTMGMTISGGVHRLVAFCMAVVTPGEIVILDEPTNDIDPLRRRMLWQEVQSIAKQGSAVLLVTHNVLEAERVVDRLVIIDQGTVRGIGTPASLKEAEGEFSSRPVQVGLVAVLFVGAAVSVALALAGVTGYVLLAVARRAREMGVLRALGFPRRGVKAGDAVEPVAVGEGQCPVAELRSPIDQIFRVRGPLQKREGTPATKLHIIGQNTYSEDGFNDFNELHGLVATDPCR